MKSLLEVLRLSSEYLEKKGIAHARREAEDLVGLALSLSRLDLYLNYTRPLNTLELEKCREYVRRRAAHEPYAYIKGFLDFFDCTLEVNPHVLIPRQETELLVSLIAEELAQNDLTHKTLWDVCCGSGCIGIALKKKFPDLQVTLSDFSEEALHTAEKNAKANNVPVRLLKGDLLKPFENLKADYVVSNPPYISFEDYAHLDSDVRDFEPKSALLAGKTGLEYYERFAEELPKFLNPGAMCWFEIGKGQGAKLLSLFSHPPFKNLHVKPDLAGHDRFFFLEKE